MNKLNGNFYNNQEIVLEIPQKKFKGYINKIENDFLYIILYASFNDRQTFEFGEQDYDISEDFSLIKNSSDFILISPELYQTLTYTPLLKDAVKNANNISIKIKINGDPAKREGREFLRINTAIQFVYEEITIEEFLETKNEYVSRPSFTTSVYGMYNITAPRIYQQSAGETESDAPVNPRIERLLIAINSKLDVMLSLFNPEASIFADVKERPVSISGSGIMWKNADKNLKQGGIIKITMLFPAVPQFIIKALAQIVKISVEGETKTDKITVACKFIAINESDRDEIIKFTLEKQRQQIKKSGS
ncbi:MAG: PilZ domain-containing protein [bacterium]